MALTKIKPGIVDSTVLSPYLLLAGGTMTGALTLSGAPTVDLHAATKKYVDDELAAAAASPATGVTVTKGGTNQSLTAGAFTKVTWSSAAGDATGWFSDANDRVTVAATGWYQIIAQVTMTTGLSSGDLLAVRLYINGTAGRRKNLTSPGTADASVTFSSLQYLIAGDYVEAYAYKGGSSTSIYGSVYETFMDVVRL